jgi:membrane protein required for colicin V production
MTNIVIQNFNWADYSIIGIIFLSAIISLVRGFIREALSLATWTVAAWIAIRFYSPLADQLVNVIKTPSFRIGAAFAIIFIIVLILGGMVSAVFSRLVNHTGLSGTDRLVGLIFGVARGILLIAVLLLMGTMTGLIKAPWWQASQLIPHFQNIVLWLQGFIPEQLHQLAKEFSSTVS